MDYLLLRRCSGNTLCAYSHRLHRGLQSGLGVRTWRLSRRPLASLAELEPKGFAEAALPSGVLEELARVRRETREALDWRPEEAERAAARAGASEVLEWSRWTFEDGGKGTRPLLLLLLSGALGAEGSSAGPAGARTVAAVAEMIHTASLVHDDVIDDSDTRRGRPSLRARLGNPRAILVGNRILAKATQHLCGLGNSEVIRLFSLILEDLVRGELMQLGDRDDFDERLSHYLEKSFKKTGSLFAHACEAMAVVASEGRGLGEAEEGRRRRLSFRLGKEVGLAFQLVDDVLDYEASAEGLGKPAGADLRAGLSTAPVLLASRSEPRLGPLIRRRFSEEGDVEEALEMARRHDGPAQALRLAHDHAEEAARAADALPDSPHSRALRDFALSQTRRQA